MSTLIPTQQSTRSGLQLDAGAASAAAMFFANNDGLVQIEVTNPTGTDKTVTITPTATIAGMPLADLEVDIPANAVTWIGVLPPALFNQPDGTVLISADLGLTLRGLRI